MRPEEEREILELDRDSSLDEAFRLASTFESAEDRSSELPLFDIDRALA